MAVRCQVPADKIALSLERCSELCEILADAPTRCRPRGESASRSLDSPALTPWEEPNTFAFQHGREVQDPQVRSSVASLDFLGKVTFRR
jgi:hypothetical protein